MVSVFLFISPWKKGLETTLPNSDIKYTLRWKAISWERNWLENVTDKCELQRTTTCKRLYTYVLESSQVEQCILFILC